MSDSVVKNALKEAIRELEKSDDIVITTSIENVVVNKLFEAVQNVSPNMLTAQELGGILSAINVTTSGFCLDDNDFQTHIGLTKNELNAVSKKLKLEEW